MMQGLALEYVLGSFRQHMQQHINGQTSPLMYSYVNKLMHEQLSVPTGCSTDMYIHVCMDTHPHTYKALRKGRASAGWG